MFSREETPYTSRFAPNPRLPTGFLFSLKYLDVQHYWMRLRETTNGKFLYQSNPIFANKALHIMYFTYIYVSVDTLLNNKLLGIFSVTF